jgi:hypothetical protein
MSDVNDDDDESAGTLSPRRLAASMLCTFMCLLAFAKLHRYQTLLQIAASVASTRGLHSQAIHLLIITA